MEPIITILKDEEILEFRIENVNISIVNAIRRILLSNIETVVIKTLPHEECQCTIINNTSRFTNEMIKQRLSCLPIYLKPEIVDLTKYEIRCSKQNDTDTIIYITTADLDIYNIETSEKLDSSQIFPPDPITNQYIDLLRLKPQLNETTPGESIEFTCTMSIGTASENSSFNVVTKATLKNTQDGPAADIAWSKHKSTIKTGEDIDFIQKNWYLLDAKRYFIENSFDFKVQTIGIWTNQELIKLACDVMHKKLENLKQILENGTIQIDESVSTIQNCYDITLVNEDYTLGKCLEYILHEKYYNATKTLSYIGFKKDHPHDNHSILRLAFREYDEEIKLKLYECLMEGIGALVQIFLAIKHLF